MYKYDVKLRLTMKFSIWGVFPRMSGEGHNETNPTCNSRQGMALTRIIYHHPPLL